MRPPPIAVVTFGLALAGLLVGSCGSGPSPSASSRSAGPSEFTVTNESGALWNDPSRDEVLRLVEQLKFGPHFLIVARVDRPPDQSYAQTVRDSGGLWVVEYQDGSLDRHFQAQSDSAATVAQVLTGWATDAPGWHDLVAWRPWQR